LPITNIATDSPKSLVLVLNAVFIIFIFIAIFGTFLIFLHASIVNFLIVIKASSSCNSSINIGVPIAFLFFYLVIIFLFVVFTIVFLVILL
jgi:hypothetical protein